MSWLLNSVGRAGLLAGISGVILLVAAPMFYVAAELGGIEAVACVAVGDMVASLLAIAGICSGGRASPWRTSGGLSGRC